MSKTNQFPELIKQSQPSSIPKLQDIEMKGKIASNKSSTSVTYALVAALFVAITSNIVLLTYYKRQGSGYGVSQQVQFVPQQYCGSQAASIEKMKLVMTETKTDKMHTHHYYRTYGRLFAHMQNDHVRLLEIGVSKGLSMQTWIRYFTNYDHIYGIGYKNYQTDLKQDIPEQNITLYMGDQSDVQFLNYVCEDAGAPFDIIIDDGSHVPKHQIVSLQNLMKCLKPGGLYIIEDIETSYWNKPGTSLYGYDFTGNGLYKNGTFIETTKMLIDVINRQYHGQLGMNFLGIDHQIASLGYEQNLVIIRKVDQWDAGLHDRKYLCNRIIC